MTDVVTLDQVTSYLRIPSGDTADNTILSTLYIPAATDIIRRECGDVIPEQYDEYYDGGDFSIWLRHTPALNIQLVEEGWGWTNYELAYVQVNSILEGEQGIDPMFAYSLDDAVTGKVTRRAGGNVPMPFLVGEGNIHVVYTTGYEDIPAVLQTAALELIAHWYQNALQRTGGTSSYDTVNTDFTRSTGMTGYNAGVPYRILEMLKPYRRAPIIG